MQIKVSEDRANKIKTNKSIRISLLEEDRIAQMGMSVTEALRMGLDMVLSGVRPGLGASPRVVSASPSVSKPVGGGSSLSDNRIWEKHVGYLDTSERVDDLDRNWMDFASDMEDSGYEITGEMRSYCERIYKRLGVGEE